MVKKTKQNNTPVSNELVGTRVEINTAVVVPEHNYQRGDEFEFNGQQVKVVEVIEKGRLHVKNKNEPYNSFIVLESEINLESKDE